MRLRFLPAAEAEVIREVTYYAKNGRRGTVARFQSAVEAASKLALRHPLGGAPSFKETRAYKVRGFPFLLVYRPSPSGFGGGLGADEPPRRLLGIASR